MMATNLADRCRETAGHEERMSKPKCMRRQKAAELCVFGCVSAATGRCSEDDRADSLWRTRGAKRTSVSAVGQAGRKNESPHRA